jgi:hypothetical protein
MPELNSETSFLVSILIFLAAAVIFAPLFRLAGPSASALGLQRLKTAII